jgi:hypothetical protein
MPSERLAHVTTYTYDASGNLVSIQQSDPPRPVSTNTYDQGGRLVQSQYTTRGPVSLEPVTTYSYDSHTGSDQVEPPPSPPPA